MKVLIYLDQKKNLLDGRDVPREATVDIDPAAFSEEQRTVLARCLNRDGVIDMREGPEEPGFARGWGWVRTGGNSRVHVPRAPLYATDATPEGIRYFLTAHAEACAAKLAEIRGEEESKIAAKLARLDMEYIYDDQYTGPRYAGDLDDADPRVSEKRERVKKLATDLRQVWQAEQEKTIAKNRADEVRDRAERQARAVAEQAETNRLFEKYANPIQRERRAAGYMFDEETDDIIAAGLYTPYGAPYQKINIGDVCTCGDCQKFSEVEVADARGLTDEQFLTLQTLQNIQPEEGTAVVRAREHNVETYCEEYARSIGFRVTLTVGPLEFVREFSGQLPGAVK